MAWWFWILLWVALVALSLLFFGFLGLKLFRSFTAMLTELEAAGTRLGSIDAGDAGAPPSGTHVPESLFGSRREAKLYYISSKLQRQEQRRLRRMERKHQRGQPQALRDLRQCQ